MFKGTIDCAEISWTLFDLSIPEWSLLFFVSMMILGIYQLLRLVWAPCGDHSAASRRTGRLWGLNTCMNFISCVP
jgi:hypothetical protein